jgi:hypothetical protein
MALTQVTGPYPIFTDLDGSPLDDGYLYIGAVNDDPETNPIQVYWDSNLTIPATQPIRTSNGYAYRNGTPALIYTAGQFSITIRNKRNEFVLYSPVGYGFDPGAVSASVVKNDFVGNGVQVAFVLSAAPSTILATNVFINGVYQEKDSYSLLGNVITFSIAPPLNSSIEVMTNETGVINSGNATAISYTLTAPGATLQTVQTKLEQYISVKDFGAVGDGVTDDTVAIQAALDYARSLVLQTASNIYDPNFPNKGGLTVYAPAGNYVITQINVPETVSLVGAGKTSTMFTSTYDGAIIRNQVVLGDGTYDKAGIYMADFAVQGDITKTSQTGIDTLRLFECKLENIIIYKCGKYGLHIRQALSCNFNNITASNNANAGIVVDEGINSWADTTPSGLPSNANILLNCHGFFNDAAGLLIQGRANGNIVLGGSYESNYLSSGNNIGFNIEVTSTTFSRNLLDGVWTEGAVQAHIYINHATAGSSTDITDWKHFGNGSSGNVDRALICDRGTVSIRNAFGQADSYKSISGSIRPFRMDVAGGDAVITVINAAGSTITDGQFVEDAAGAAFTTTYQENQGRPISGINFTDTPASSNVNILDDYLEGFWTPTLTTDGTDFTTVTYDAITGGRYTKIGNVVHVQGAIRTDAVNTAGATGFVVIGGLPFTSVGNSAGTNDGYAAGSISTTSAL